MKILIFLSRESTTIREMQLRINYNPSYFIVFYAVYKFLILIFAGFLSKTGASNG